MKAKFDYFSATSAIALRLTTALIMSVALLAARPALADDGVTVSGTVTSSEGAPVTGATLTFSGNGPIRSTRSDARGRFRIEALHAGTFAVTASAKGYGTVAERTISVVTGTPSSLVFTLSPVQASSLTVIGGVRSNGAAALSTAPAPALDLNAQRYAARGVTRTSDILAEQLSTTVVPVLGGGLGAPAVVALRGRDASETLVDMDGHQVNSGGTGDFDLSLLDPADLQSVQVLYGIAPSSLFGPNTIGGALNLRTLEPTATPHALERLSYGSFGSFGGTLQATGTVDRLGYALSYHRTTLAGIDRLTLPNTSGTGTSTVGNGLAATSTIAKLRYSLGRGDSFVGLSIRDQSAFRDLSATLSSVSTAADGGTLYDDRAGTGSQSNNAAYGLDAHFALGRPDSSGIVPWSATFRHQSSFVSQSVFGPGVASSPYLYNDRDLIGDDTLELTRILPRGNLSLKFALTNENLATDFVAGVIDEDAVARRRVTFFPAAVRRVVPQDADDAPAPPGSAASSVFLAQTQRSVGLRYAADPTSKLHYTFAGYYSNYSTFGHSLDPRFGFVWTPKAESAVRFSVGSTFEAPQLPSLLVPTVYPAAVDGYVTIGNPNLSAERATEYDLGYQHVFHIPRHDLHTAIDLYRTNLYNGIIGFRGKTTCVTGVDYGNAPPCLSFPINVAREVYQGVEARADFPLNSDTSLHATYDIDSSYLMSYPRDIASAALPYQQDLGVPLHKIGLTLDHERPRGLSYYAGLLYEGSYNELNLGPYATLKAGLTWRTRDYELGFNGTNLTNVYGFNIARQGGGVVYDTAAGPFAATAYPLAGRQIIVTLTHRT